MARKKHRTNREITPSQDATSLQQRGSSASTHASVQVTHTRGELRIQQGLLASVDELARLDEIVPGSAEIVINEFRETGPHRRKMEAQALKIDGNSSFRGQVFGLVVALAFLGVSAFLVYNGHDLAGTFLGTVDIVALVGAFVYGANNRRQEREDRLRLLTGQPVQSNQGKRRGR